MRNHEIRQKGESREDFAKRVSKLPILSPNTILRAVFPTVRMDTLRYIKDCARPVFPKAFPPEDSNGTPYLNPEKMTRQSARIQQNTKIESPVPARSIPLVSINNPKFGS